MKIYILIILFACCLSINAQNRNQQGEIALVNVLYDFYHKNDLNHANFTNHQEMLLSIGKDWSRYQNFDYTQNAKRAMKMMNDLFASGKIGRRVQGRPSLTVYSDNKINSKIFQNTSKNELHEIDYIGSKDYLLENMVLPKINWIIKNEKKKLGEFEVQRADGRYAGRNYTAWFCADLPFTNGPWKLSGLPGLILEAQDATGEVKFLFREIYSDEEPVRLNYDGSVKEFIKVSRKQLDRLSFIFNNDPLGTMRSQGLTYIDESHVTFIDDSKTQIKGKDVLEKIKEKNTKRKLRRENPLELTK